MSVAITVQLSPESQRFIRDMTPEKSIEAIKTGMNKALPIVTGRVIENRLFGKGPFPVAEHKLGQVSGKLAESTRWTDATITSSGEQAEVTGAIGASVFYAKIHEFGGKRAPERAPFRTGITENIPYIVEEIEKALEANFNKR